VKIAPLDIVPSVGRSAQMPNAKRGTARGQLARCIANSSVNFDMPMGSIIDGQQVKPLVKVHILRLRRLKKWFLEITQLDLIWLKAAEAVKRANEPGLKRPLRSVDRKLDGRS
jgi:hypothetical protein